MDAKRKEALEQSITNDALHYFKGVLYGEFGVRKTTTALRCSRKRAILLHADQGWQVYKNHLEEFGDRVIPMAYESPSQISAIIDAVLDNETPFDDIDLIVVDTISQVQEEYVDFLLENAKYGGNFREKAIPNSGVKIEGGLEIPGMPDYHLARNKLRPHITRLTKAPVNVIYLAHVREPGPIERSAGKLERRPNVTEALYKVIARNATFIGYMTRDKGYQVDFTPKNTQSAKSQIPSLTDQKISTDKLPQHLFDWIDN